MMNLPPHPPHNSENVTTNLSEVKYSCAIFSNSGELRQRELHTPQTREMPGAMMGKPDATQVTMNKEKLEC